MNEANPIQVLVLEDELHCYELLRYYIGQAASGYVFERVVTLADAVEKLRSARYDVVVSDLYVPDSSGVATISTLRERFDSLPIVAMTGVDNDATEEAVLDAGAQDYLVKGETDGRVAARAIRHAIRRQQIVNEQSRLHAELSESRTKLQEQAVLLQAKNERLRCLNELASEFVDNVSHDFRTPLTVIKDFVSLIREGLVGEINSEQESMLDKVSVRADDLNNMVDDLLDVSKLDSGMLSCWRRNSQPAALLTRAEALLAQRAAVKGVELAIEYPDDLPEVFCDTDKADRVITNLAVNAIKFTPAGGRVRLWAEADPINQQVVIGVTDTGPGIAPTDVEQLFERFNQLEAAAEANIKGFGLGLSIAQKLTRLNLGELGVRSVVGQGSTFSFTIPYAEPTEVFRRWQGVAGEAAGADDSASRLVEIKVDPPAEDRGPAVDEFDRFLNAVARSKDLLLRVAEDRWLYTVRVASPEATAWRDRIEKEFARTNRNRPDGPLPSYEIATHFLWDASNPAADRVQDFRAACRAAATTTAYTTA